MKKSENKIIIICIITVLILCAIFLFLGIAFFVGTFTRSVVEDIKIESFEGASKLQEIGMNSEQIESAVEILEQTGFNGISFINPNGYDNAYYFNSASPKGLDFRMYLNTNKQIVQIENNNNILYDSGNVYMSADEFCFDTEKTNYYVEMILKEAYQRYPFEEVNVIPFNGGPHFHMINPESQHILVTGVLELIDENGDIENASFNVEIKNKEFEQFYLQKVEIQ